MFNENVYDSNNQNIVSFQQYRPECPFKLQSPQSHDMIVVIEEH